MVSRLWAGLSCWVATNSEPLTFWFDQGAFDFDFADLRFLGQPVPGVDRRGFIGGLRAGLQAVGDRGVGGEALGQGYHRFLHLGLDQGLRSFEPFVFDVQVEVKAGGRGGRLGGRFGADRRG